MHCSRSDFSPRFAFQFTNPFFTHNSNQQQKTSVVADSLLQKSELPAGLFTCISCKALDFENVKQHAMRTGVIRLWIFLLACSQVCIARGDEPSAGTTAGPSGVS